ncbi:MAG TPA: hypothetical protein VHU42_04680 [Rhodopila sp.]|nr:hypothetical protein [Rhodopila sp.]
MAALQATIQFQAEKLGEYRNKAPKRESASTDGPKLMLAMSGGNVFVPEAPDVRDRLTGIHLDVQIWNVGLPSIATEWSLVVIPQGQLPVVAQLARMPELLRAGGPYSSVVLRGSEALDARTRADPVTENITDGPLLFYVPLPKIIVMDPNTRLELTIKDVNGVGKTATKIIGEWLSR